MATIRGGKIFEAKMLELAKKLNRKETLRVGFLEGATYPDGTSVAFVGATQNYGAPKAGIPPRPFFSNMVAEKSPEWPGAIAIQLLKNNYDIEAALKITGEAIVGQLQASIVATNSPPLKEATLAARGVAGMVYDPNDQKTFGAKPLIDTGHMYNSVAFEIKS